jgi:hypothetical protein
MFDLVRYACHHLGDGNAARTDGNPLTLTITLVTPFAIYQSADFAIRGLKDKSFSRDDSAKMVMLQYFSWTGFVTYTGLGFWRGDHVSELIANWLDDRQHRTMWEVATVLQSEGARLLSDARSAGEYSGRHTFTLAGFEDNSIRVFVISNFENCYNEERSTIDDYLTISSREFQTWAGAAVIVTGQKKAVPVMQKRALRKLARINSEDGELIRRRMQEMNAEASNWLATRTEVNPVSPDCAVASFRFDGYGRLSLSDMPGMGAKQIPIIVNGLYQNKFIAEAMAKAGMDMSNARMDNVTFASSKAPGPAGLPRTACSFPVVNTDKSGGYEIHEITAIDFQPEWAYDTSELGHVVGTGREEAVATATTIPWLMRDGQLSRLNFSGNAWAINENDQMAAMLHGVIGEQAALYAEGSIRQFSLYGADVAQMGGNRSTAGAINAAGVIAGSVSYESQIIRPAVFREAFPPVVFLEPPQQWGTRSIGIDDQGQVLVHANFGPGDVRSILWNFENGSWYFVGGDTASVQPVAVTSNGLVLGVSKSGTAHVALICEPGGAWLELGSSDGWSPTAINDVGDVVGIVMRDGLFYPWLRLASGEEFLLPYVRGHQTNPKAINNAGTIVGTAQTDHGGHAVIWHRV